MEEEKTMRNTTKRESSYESRFVNRYSHRAGTFTLYEQDTTQQRIAKKVGEDDDEEQKILEQCMQSEPNKLTMDKIKKLGAYLWSFGQNTKGELSIGNYNEALMPERARGLQKLQVVHLSSGAKHTGVVTMDG